VTSLAEEVITLLHASRKSSDPSRACLKEPGDALLCSMRSMESTLSSSPLDRQVDILFAALKRGIRDDANRSEVQSLLRMWQPSLGAAAGNIQSVVEACPTGDSLELYQQCTAGAADAPKIIQAVEEQCELSGGLGSMPLYLVSTHS
jgi:hypothetical protein